MNLIIPEMPFYADLARKVTAAKKEVFLYGLGKIGKQTFSALSAAGIPVRAIFDENTHLQGAIWEGVPICDPDVYYGSTIPVVIGSFRFYREILNKLRRFGFQNVLPYFFYMFGKTVDIETYLQTMQGYGMIERQMRQEDIDEKLLLLTSVDLVVTEKCSLRCKDCANLMQYFQAPQHTSFEDCIHSFERLADAVDLIQEVRVLGGEPFMNTDLARILDVLSGFKCYQFLIVYTNATITPSKALLRAMQNSHTIVFITDYENPNQKCEKLVEILAELGIMYVYKHIIYWQDCGVIQHYNRTIGENKVIYRNCCMRDFLSLKDGKLYLCPYAGSLDSLSAAPPNRIECVDLLDFQVSITNIREKIFRLTALPMQEACNYCNGRPSEGFNIAAALQTDAPLYYKQY